MSMVEAVVPRQAVRLATSLADSRALTLFAALATSVLTWPITSLGLSQLREEWPIGLHLAAADGLRYGHDLVFTYGPLGFLAFPILVTSTTGIASFVYTVAAHTALAAVVLRILRPRNGWLVTLALAVVVCALPVPPSELPAVVFFAACVWVLQQSSPPANVWMLPAGAAVAALALLIKTNVGLLCLALAALTAWRLPPRGIKAEGSFFALTSAAIAGLWLLIGMRPGDLPTFLRMSVHLVASYGQGMAVDGGMPGDFGTAAVILVGLLALVAATARRLDTGAVLLAAVAVFEYAYFKEGFIRHDATHAQVFFAVLPVAILSIRWENAAQAFLAITLAAVAVSHLLGTGSALAGVLFVAGALVAEKALARRPRGRGLACVVLVGVFAVLSARQSVTRVSDTKTFWVAVCLAVITLRWHQPLVRLFTVGVVIMSLVVMASAHQLNDLLPVHPTVTSHAYAQLRTLASGSRRRAAIGAYRAELRRIDSLPRSTLVELRGKTVDIQPDGAGTAWAYGLDWRPEPTIESYAAYDTTIDEFAANVVAHRGPSRIIQRWQSIDGQNPAWQGPALVLSEVCNYRGTDRTSSLLVRSAGRCGAPTLLGEEPAREGAWVSVPTAGPRDIVYATMSLPQTIVGRLRSLLYKPSQLVIETRPGRTVYRLIAGNAADPHLLRLPAIRSLPSPSGVPVARLRFVDAPEPVQIWFYSMPVLR